jgi:very-short-patch-repair endonuclease
LATDLSRKLRAKSSPPERAMWSILRPFRDAGHHFRRQVQLGAYYVDFVSLSHSLVIEVDGDTHGTDLAQGNDAVRDDYLKGRGFRVLRFWNNEVMTNPDGVYLVVERVLAERSEAVAPPTPDPSPQGGGRRRGRGVAR